ncbi:glycosyltransferase [Bifidobacterium felsineum]|uniref:glycosyltransferase n=1 Tax=Bifidobacterium felsineum TaxID=2045440 RepID=UPI001BDBCF00|nr:glycosyltransferase [Bifidobacterium felsineum]MBT1165159.1 glycosyltransferase [Bifidobacterium felsineum]
MKNTIAAGIVIFNPDNISRVNDNIHITASQVEKLYIYDNSTGKNNIDIPNNAVYYTDNHNHGIAYALNYLMRKAMNDGFTWMLTLDQDSIIEKGMLQDFESYTKDDKIGIICPQYYDKRRPYLKVKDSNSIDYIKETITSGSCTSINAWKEIGEFDEYMFIDLVDNEFCKRLTISGYKIIRLNKWVLDQEFGNIEPKNKFQQKLWIKLSEILRCQNIAKLSYKKNVSPLRVYYTCRNIIYANRKLRAYGKVGFNNYNCHSYLGFIPCYIIPSFIRSNNKKKVLEAIIKGTIEGLKKQVAEWQVVHN